MRLAFAKTQLTLRMWAYVANVACKTAPSFRRRTDDIAVKHVAIFSSEKERRRAVPVGDRPHDPKWLLKVWPPFVWNPHVGAPEAGMSERQVLAIAASWPARPGSNPAAIEIPGFEMVGHIHVAFQQVLWYIPVGNQEVLLQCPKNPTSCREP